jgi:hypothetical protein
MNRMTRVMLAVTVALLSAGCVQTPTRVDVARSEAPDKSYTVDLPVGWIKQASVDNRKLFASRDGFLLEAIEVSKLPPKEAFPKTKKAASDNMLPSELAELEVAEIKAEDQYTAALNVIENEPAEIGGHEGFRIRVSFKNARGLEVQRVAAGFADKAAYYQLAFQAPMLYYFDTYYPEFEKTLASFQLAGNAKKTGRMPAPAIAVRADRPALH